MGDKKNYRIPISTGIYEHYGRIKSAIWFLYWCIDKTTKECPDAGGIQLGSVLGGMPVHDEDVAGAFGCSAETVRWWRRRLVREGYLLQKRTPYGHILKVVKSKKWPERESGKKLPVSPERTRVSTGGAVKSTALIKTRQDKTESQSQKEPEKKMYEADRTLTLVNEIWKRLEISTLPESFANFVRLAESVKPRPRETVGRWGQRVLSICQQKSVLYPKALLRAVKDAERNRDNRPLLQIPPGATIRAMELRQKATQTLEGLNPAEQEEYNGLKELLHR